MSDERVIHEILCEETKRRLAVMEDTVYRFPEELPFLDKILILVGIISSLMLLAVCMMGG